MRGLTGFLLSLDALLAVGFLFSLIVFLSSLNFVYSAPEIEYQKIYYSGKDVLNIMETLNMEDIRDNLIVQSYLSQGILNENDMEKTVLDAVGSLWSGGKTTKARDLFESVFNNMLDDSKYGYEVLIDGTRVYLKNITTMDYRARLSTVVSGYAVGEPVSGFVARTYLKRSTKVYSRYVYFGGYEGDGNITKIIELPKYDDILSVYMELDTGNNFNLYVNDNSAGNYVAESTSENGNMTADKWTVCDSSTNPDYCQNFFSSGQNEININFTSNENMYIGGGYIRVRFNTSETNTTPVNLYGENATQKYKFPGIQGIVNLYSSFYVPGELTGMDIYFHFDSVYKMFLNIGNVTVFEGNDTGEVNITLTDSVLRSILDYQSISGRTIPIRTGVVNASFLAARGGGNLDTILTTEVAGSMDACGSYLCGYSCDIGNQSCFIDLDSQCTGNVCGGTCDNPVGHNTICSQTKLEIAKEADIVFVDTVLNLSGNKIGLLSYHASTESGQNEPLTTDNTVLHNKINSYHTKADNKCFSCAIVDSRQMLLDDSNSSRDRVIILMSDGAANKCYPGSSCPSAEAKQEAIDEACDTYNIHNITIDSIGFGDDVDGVTLKAISDCAHGSYYFSNVTELVNLYKQVAEEWVNATYDVQTITVYGNTSKNNILYSDSYISFNYTSDISPLEYGQIVLSFESKRFGELTGNDSITHNATGTKEGWYFIPENTEPVDVMTVSYSSKYWTDRLYVKNSTGSTWENIYWLDDFNKDYEDLGDPYILHIPVSYVTTGNNSVRVGAGSDFSNPVGGSRDDKVIYDLKINSITQTGYSRPFAKANGSSVTVYYDIDGDNIVDGSSLVRYGSKPSDSFDPEDDAIDDAFMRLMTLQETHTTVLIPPIL
jgi:hypothetical protein